MIKKGENRICDMKTRETQCVLHTHTNTPNTTNVQCSVVWTSKDSAAS